MIHRPAWIEAAFVAAFFLLLQSSNIERIFTYYEVKKALKEVNA